MTRRVVEIDTLADFDAHIRRARRLNGWFVSGLDLTDRDEHLADVDARGAVFLGCRFLPATEERLREGGALLFPRLPDLPFDPYRGTLYDADELYGTTAYAASPDATTYAWSRLTSDRSLTEQLATTLHDRAITEALDDALEGVEPRRVVGVMGGHALQRGEVPYRAAVELGARLTAAGRTVLTGGGPGAMEAANLGAYLSPHLGGSPDVLDDAVAVLAAAPSYRPRIDPWVDAAREVRTRWPVHQTGASFSVPTWFYGHEPSNLFASGIAKYFGNALREDTLLHRCRGGIVYLPGQAGTVQEIFQAVTENFYAADPALITPLVLVGTAYWNDTLPAWPLLQALGRDRAMGDVVWCVDDVATAADRLLREVPRGPE